MPQIREALPKLNVWWKERFKTNYKEREIYGSLRKFMRTPQILALTGLRRTGKTTLMLKMAEDAIAGGMEPLDVLYFTFDDFREADIDGLIKEYESTTGRSAIEGRKLLLLDEIQKLNGWEDKLKAVYDMLRMRGSGTKIVISGSESLLIRRKSKETLAGRLFEFRVEPLTFREFLAFRGRKYEPPGVYARELSSLLTEFSKTMGFPELVGVTDKEIIRKYLKESVAEKIIYRDIPSILGPKDVGLLESLLNILSEHPGQILDFSGLAKELGVARQTVATYLTYLEDAFLVRKLYNFSRNRRKVERKLRKYYPAMISTDLLFSEDETSRSKVFEWLLVGQLKAEFFWRDAFKNEVDVVIPSKEPVPVEIKYGKAETRGVARFLKTFGAKEGYVLTKDTEATHRDGRAIIHVVPAWRFLLRKPAAV